VSPAAVGAALPPRLAVAHCLGRTALGRHLYDLRPAAPPIGLADWALLFLGLQSARQLITPPMEGSS
jgi:hypothetical protein